MTTTAADIVVMADGSRAVPGTSHIFGWPDTPAGTGDAAAVHRAMLGGSAPEGSDTVTFTRDPNSFISCFALLYRPGVGWRLGRVSPLVTGARSKPEEATLALTCVTEYGRFHGDPDSWAWLDLSAVFDVLPTCSSVPDRNYQALFESVRLDVLAQTDRAAAQTEGVLLSLTDPDLGRQVTRLRVERAASATV